MLLLSSPLISCTDKKTINNDIHFTKEDSLTDRYLSLQDSMLHTWNVMIKDDNQKLKSMYHLLHELDITKQVSAEQIAILERRLEQLTRIRYTEKTLANPDVVEEYDFASNSMIAELTALATSVSVYTQNTTIQGLVETINMADQRTFIYRAEYDAAVTRYNAFISTNKLFIKEIDPNNLLDQKPLFDMLAEE